MAASAMTPKLLGRISNERYQDKDKWKIDDIALGPANELLISGHNQKIPKTFISIHKESFGNYQNRPEFNKTLRQHQPVDQLVLFLEGSIIGLKVDKTLRFLSTEDMDVSKTLKWKRSPTCVCFYKGKLYAVSSSSTTVSVCNLDLEVEKYIFLSDMKNDRVLEIVVVMEDLYVCTKNSGQALVFSTTGSKKMEFKNDIQTDAMANSICIHERKALVFVSWSNFQIQLFSQKTSRCLRAFDMTEKLHKILVTTENRLVTLSSSKCIVTVYDVARTNEEKEEKCCNLTKQLKAEKKTTEEDDIDRRKKENKDDATEELENTRLNLSSKEADLSDVQAKLDAARTESDDLRRMNEEKEEKCCRLTKQLESERKTTKKFNERIRDLEGMRTELEIQQKKLKNNLEEEKEKVTCAEGSRVQVVTNLKKVEERNTKLEAEVTQLKERLLAEEKTAKEMQTSSLKVETNLRIEEERNTKLEAEVTQLKERLLAEENIAKEMQTSTLKLNERIKDLEDMRTELESQQKKLKDNLEEEKVTRGEGSRVQERIKYLEGIRTKLESEQKELKDKLEEEKKKATTSIEKLERAKEILEKEKEHLYIQLSTEKRITERQKAALSKSSTAKHYDSMKSALLQIQNVVDKSLHSIDEHQIIQVNPLDSMQGKDNLERRTSSRRTGKISRFLPKMRKRYSREIVGTQVEKMQQEERGYSSDSTFDSQSTSGYEAASEFESGGTFKSGSAAKIQHDKPSIKTDPATDHESTSGYETASEFEWERTVSPGSASKQHDDEPNFTSDSATDYEVLLFCYCVTNRLAIPTLLSKAAIRKKNNPHKHKRFL